MTACPTRADTLTGELCRVIKRPHCVPMSSLQNDAAATPSVPLLVLVRDLLFSSRIAVAARHLGVEIKLLRESRQLTAEAGGRLIVDLNQAGALDAAIEWRRGGHARQVIGFVAHVDAETIRRARDAGIDQVLPRSRFVAELESLLRGDA
jgi:hypothetical protein